MFKKTCALMLGCFVVACGSDEGAFGELGDAEQHFTGRNSTSYQFGTRTASSATACNRSSTGQVCTIPSLHGRGLNIVTWQFATGSGLTDAEKQAVRDEIRRLGTVLNRWLFSETTGGGADIEFTRGTVTGASSSNNIDAFRGMQFAGSTDLEEGAGVVGHYKSHDECRVTLDIADIATRAVTATEIAKLRAHVVQSGAMACLGLGTRDDATSAGKFIDRTVVVPGPASRPSMSDGDLCRVNNFVPTDDGRFNLSSGVCSD